MADVLGGHAYNSEDVALCRTRYAVVRQGRWSRNANAQHRSVLGDCVGGPGRNRTFNLRIKSPLLCQLSYEPDLRARGARVSWRASSSLSIPQSRQNPWARRNSRCIRRCACGLIHSPLVQKRFGPKKHAKETPLHPAHESCERWLHRYQAEASERGDVEQMLKLLQTGSDGAEGPSPFSRDHVVPGHFTASAFVLDKNGSGLILIYHGKLHRWLQPGGHIEADDATIVAAAKREVAEEIGLGPDDVTLVGDADAPIFDVDIHKIPARKSDPDHLHLDVRVLFQARGGHVVAGSDAKAVKTVPLDAITEAETDASVMRAVKKVRARSA